MPTLSDVRQAHIAGIDPSLRSTGYADSEGTSAMRCGDRRGAERLQYLTREVQFALARRGAQALAVLEGAAYAARGRQHSVGELAGALKVGIFDSGHLQAVVPPSSLKVFITGKGNASKEDMAEAIRRTAHLVWEGPGADDMADAWALREAGVWAVLAALGLPVACPWPGLTKMLDGSEFPDDEVLRRWWAGQPAPLL